jgi:hypothetical protein
VLLRGVIDARHSEAVRSPVDYEKSNTACGDQPAASLPWAYLGLHGWRCMPFITSCRDTKGPVAQPHSSTAMSASFAALSPSYSQYSHVADRPSLTFALVRDTRYGHAHLAAHSHARTPASKHTRKQAHPQASTPASTREMPRAWDRDPACTGPSRTRSARRRHHLPTAAHEQDRSRGASGGERSRTKSPLLLMRLHPTAQDTQVKQCMHMWARANAAVVCCAVLCAPQG